MKANLELSAFKNDIMYLMMATLCLFLLLSC
uniref:Uncharacterized protein n=1 Tax=Arundo donax TaxID=35708 RepID=A0A0A9EL83_ARUDO